MCNVPAPMCPLAIMLQWNRLERCVRAATQQDQGIRRSERKVVLLHRRAIKAVSTSEVGPVGIGRSTRFEVDGKDASRSTTALADGGLTGRERAGIRLPRLPTGWLLGDVALAFRSEVSRTVPRKSPRARRVGANCNEIKPMRHLSIGLLLGSCSERHRYERETETFCSRGRLPSRRCC